MCLNEFKKPLATSGLSIRWDGWRLFALQKEKIQGGWLLAIGEAFARGLSLQAENALWAKERTTFAFAEQTQSGQTLRSGQNKKDTDLVSFLFWLGILFVI